MCRESTKSGFVRSYVVIEDVDSNPIKKGDNVKIINGKLKGTKAVIKEIVKGRLFLYDDYLKSAYKIIVENPNNVLIVGNEMIELGTGSKKDNSFKKNAIGFRKGDEIAIIDGKWKGYTGTIKTIDRNKGIINLNALAMNVTVSLKEISLLLATKINDSARSSKSQIN